MSIIGAGVTLSGLVPQVFAWTWNVSGTVTQANIGDLVAQDTTADNTVKLLGNGDQPIGLLASYENRVIEGIKVGTVDHKGGFTVKYTGTLARGNSVVGSATPGSVKRYDDGAGTPVPLSNRTLVTSVDAGAGTCTVIFL